MSNKESAPCADERTKRDVPQSVFDSAAARRVTAAGHAQACRELEMTPRNLLDKGNPNHPDYDAKLFGYDAAEFMAKQYREDKPGKWSPIERPYRVSFSTKTGRRYDAHRSTVYTFATEREARDCMNTLADKRPHLDVAMNAATWRKNGYWRALSVGTER